MFSPTGRVLVSFAVATVFLVVPRLIVDQPSTAKNLLIVTLDGFRWQEVFGGADSALPLMGIDFEPGDAIDEIIERLPSSDAYTGGNN